MRRVAWIIGLVIVSTVLSGSGLHAQESPSSLNGLAHFTATIELSTFAQQPEIVSLSPGETKRLQCGAARAGGGVLCNQQFKVEVPSGMSGVTVSVSGVGSFELLGLYGEPIRITDQGVRYSLLLNSKSRNGEASVGVFPFQGSAYIAIGNYETREQNFVITATGIRPERLSSGSSQSGSCRAGVVHPTSGRVVPMPCLTQYTIEVPSGSGTLIVSVESSNLLLVLVRYDRRVELSSSLDFLRDKEGISGADIVIEKPRSGTYYIALVNTESSTARFTIKASVKAAAEPPRADFTADPTSGTVPLTVRFTDRSTPAGEIASWRWEFGDGGTSSERNPTYTYRNPGTFTVKLTVRSPGGEDTKTRSNYIEVKPAPIRPTADFTADPTSGTVPLTVRFTDRSTPAGEIASWRWEFGDGGTSSERNPTYTYRNPGIFTVKLTVRSSGGEDTKTRSNYITVIGPPRAPSNLTATTRSQTQIDLSWSDNSDNEEGFEILRKIQGQSYSPLKKVSANSTSYSDTGLTSGTTYCYQVRAYNTAGNSDLSNESCATTERAVSPPVADFEANPTRGQAPLTVQFTDRSTGEITSWRWEFGDGGTSTERNPIYVYRTPGTFTVKLTVRGPGGESSKTGTIEVLPPPPEVRSFDFEATAEQGKLAIIPLPDSIKNQLPGVGVRYVEVPNTTRRGRTSNSLKDVGLDLNPDTGTILGTPNAVGKFYFLIEARGDTAVLAEIWAIITITASGQPPQPPPSGAGIPLVSGQPQKGTVGAGPKALSDQYTISVLEGTWALFVKLQGTGNVNLHVRLGKPVEVVAGEIIADFSSTSPTGSESISLTGPVQPGTYYIAIENTESSPQTFTILAAVVPVLQMVNPGEPISGRVEPAPLGGRVLALAQYVVEVPEGAKNLSAVLENLGLGDMKLHMRYGKPVEISGDRVVADFSSDAPLGIESITIAGAQLRVGKYYIAIENLEPYAQDFKLTVTLTR